MNELTAREGGRSVFGLSVGQRSRKEGGVVFVFEDVFFIRGGRGGGLLVWRRSRLGEGGNPQLLLSILSLPRRWSKTGSTDGCVTDAFPPLPSPRGGGGGGGERASEKQTCFYCSFSLFLLWLSHHTTTSTVHCCSPSEDGGSVCGTAKTIFLPIMQAQQ